jgi:hypothetical protein
MDDDEKSLIIGLLAASLGGKKITTLDTKTDPCCCA